jgi:signal transduction histidine kinase
LRNRALILDNNPINAELLTEVLGQIGIESKVLYCAKALFDLLEQEEFDLIFLDIMTPFINGYEVLEELSNNPVSQNIPVIFLSAMSETNDIVKGLELGCYDYITKPYRIEELQAKIKNILKLKKLQEERECFIETVTHDLKTPVRSEIRAVELLLEGHFGDLKESQIEVLEEILNSSNYMFFMLDSILSKYKFDQNKIKLVPVKFSINSLIQDCVQELKILFEAKNQNVSIFSENTVDEVTADYQAIKRTIINLISNAIKFSKSSSSIEIRIFDNDQNVSVSVIDRGQGISSDEMKDIFEYKKENVKKFRQVGSGLGLYISQKIIALHGGNIKVQSQKGEGSNFTISLPKKKMVEKKEAVLF